MKKLFFDKKYIDDVCEKYPTPFHLYDEKGIRDGIRRLQKAFSWNEGYKEYFAVKACPNPFLIKMMIEEGCGVDCSSYTELMLAESLGCKGDDIMFSSNVTPAEDFQYASDLNAIINLDDFSHIDFLAENGGIPETIFIRYNPGGDFKIDNAIMGRPADAKYGFTHEQSIEGLKKLMKMGAKRFGIHAFLASNMTNNDYYPKLARVLFETAVELNKATGADIKYINLSGGIGIPYRPEDNSPDLEYIGAEVKKAYDEVIAPSALGSVTLKTELGRYITGPHGVLVTKVLHEKITYKDYIGVDACAANLMRPAIYGAYHHIIVVGKEDMPCDYTYDVTGGLCENNDKFAIDRQLPKIEKGDIIAIMDAGAHGYAMGYNYNGKLRSAELLKCEDGSTKLIRRAETPKDYFATFDFSDIIKC